MWNNRFAFSGEIPLDFPELSPVALQRITPGAGAFYSDSVTPSRNWERITGGANDGYASGNWGLQMGLNSVNPATDKGGFELPNFAGLWPSAGRLLVGLWTRQSYTMSFSPLMSTRGGTSPLVYLSTSNSGQIRHGVYNASGGLVLDSYEVHPWRATFGYQFVGMLVDFDALTSQMFSVDVATKKHWLGPVRSLSGPPNAASTANLDIYRLQNSGYWTSGAFDEAIVAHPGAAFDLNGFAESMALGQWADGQSSTNRTKLNVTDSGVTATSAATLSTGAEQVTWTEKPVVQGMPAEGVPYWSSDDGATWQTGELPAIFTGLLRWEIPLSAGQSFTGATLTEPDGPPPTLGAIADQSLEQGESANIPLSYTVSEFPSSWTATASGHVTASIAGDVLTIASGYLVGSGTVTVTLTDGLGRSTSRTFGVTVTAREWSSDAPPDYPNAPIVYYGPDGQPDGLIFDALGAVVTTEVNGEHKLEFTLSIDSRYALVMRNERLVEVAGEQYRIRRISRKRTGRKVQISFYAEAMFYDLATAGQIGASDWVQVAAGDVMSDALKGTGWTVGIANVTTLRTYSTEDTNPLALLREVQANHGGDLIFDNKARKVSLVANSARDNGVSFFYGRGLTDPQRVVDTTSLITRIYAKNADGQTIANVNNGVPYVEDFSYTSEIRSATYDFKSGVSPYTMLAMVNATLANRSKPSYSYEVTVSDMSAQSGNPLDRFDAGDLVTVVDEEVGITGTQRIIKLEYDVLRPWASKVTLSAKLRELGSSESTDAGTLDTGAGSGTFDLVPFNLLLNARFDNDLAHWAHLGAEVVEGNGTGDYAVKFSGAGERWIEQTVAPDNRDAYAFSFDVESTGPSGYVPNLVATAEIVYEDGTTETVELDLS